MKKTISILIALILQGCASIDFDPVINYKRLENIAERQIIGKHESQGGKIIEERIDFGWNKTVIFHVVCMFDQCQKDDKYLVYKYAINGYVKDPSTYYRTFEKPRHDKWNSAINAKEYENYIMSGAELAEYRATIIKDAEAMKTERAKIEKEQNEISRHNAQVAEQKNKEEAELMKTAKYQPKIKIKRTFDVSCLGGCSRTNYKEVISIDRIPFVITKVQINERCEFNGFPRGPIHLGESFNLIETNIPNIGCGEILIITLYTNRGVFNYYP